MKPVWKKNKQKNDLLVAFSTILALKLCVESTVDTTTSYSSLSDK